VKAAFGPRRARNEASPTSQTVDEAVNIALPASPMDLEAIEETEEATTNAKKPLAAGSPGKLSSASKEGDKQDAPMNWADECEKDFITVKNRKKEAQEAKKKASEAEVREIIATLWPTEKERSAFFKKHGTSLDWGSIRSSKRFKDSWHDLKKATSDPKRAEDLRYRTKSRVLDIIYNRIESRRSKEKEAAKKDEPKPSTSKGAKSSTPYVKRNRSVLSSPSPNASNLSYGDVAKKQAKIQKLASEWDGSEEKLEELLVDVEELTTDELEKTRREETKDESEKKVDYEWVLFVTKGERRDSISREEWKLFHMKLTEEVMRRQLNDQVYPVADWAGFSKGLGIIACVSKEDRELAKEIVSQITVEDTVFAAHGKGEKGKYTQVVFEAPPEFVEQKPEAILKVIVKVNKLPECFSMRNSAKLKNKKTLVRIIAEDEFVTSLKALDKVRVGLATVTFSLPNEPN